MVDNKLIRLIYSDLDSELKYNEMVLENLLNSEITLTLHTECIDVLKKIAHIKDTINVLNNYLGI